jgi:hypothetical protein
MDDNGILIPSDDDDSDASDDGGVEEDSRDLGPQAPQQTRRKESVAKWHNAI